MNDLVLSLSALLAMMPAAIVGLRAERQHDGLFWLLILVALAGPGAWVAAQLAASTWKTGLSTTLWVTVFVSLALFVVLAATTRQGKRLTPLLMPYLLILGGLATVWETAAGAPMAANVPPTWVGVHIIVSVLTYGLVTVAAVAALAAFLQERALKTKRPTSLTRRLPSVSDSEGLMVRLLVASEIVLALGLITGMAVQHLETGDLVVWDHKTAFSFATFFVIGGLLTAHFVSGVRGRLAARLVLVAYLLLTLAFPGVKFVTDVLVA